MSIRKRILFASLLLISLFIVQELVNRIGNRSIMHMTESAYLFKDAEMRLHGLLRGSNEFVIDEGEPLSLEIINKNIIGFEETIQNIKKTLTDKELNEIVVIKIDPQWKKVKKGFQSYTELSDVSYNNDSAMRQYGKLLTNVEPLVNQLESLALRTQQSASMTATRTKSFITAVSLIIFGLLAFLLWSLYKSITRPIGNLMNITEGFNRGDLSILMDESRNDEFGTMAKCFNKSVKNLEQTALSLRERTKELSHKNSQLESEISEHEQTQEAISHMAYHDTLTSLPNRDLFYDRLNVYISQIKRHKKKAAVLFIDIDDFKRINDTLGHTVGDLLLKEVAGRFTTSIRAVDTVSRPAIFDDSTSTVARLGGDEFTLLLTDIIDSQSAVKVAERLMEAVLQPFHLNGNEIFITLSIGIALCPEDGEKADDVLKNADTAMYHAKNRGKNNFQFYKESMNAVYLKRLTMESDLRKAIENNEIIVYYQPRIDCRSGRIVSMEALVRWQQPGKGLISPGEFIPVAEETGLIIPLGEWILNKACVQNKIWQEQGHPKMVVSVNISGKQVQQEHFLEMVLAALRQSSLDPGYLELELTETVLMKNADTTIVLLDELKKTGVRLAMDDFGTGYSSFSYLKRFPLDIIKIDKSFIDDIPDKIETAAIVNAMTSMAHSLNLKVVAEGVESKQQLDFLYAHQCDEVQGYYFSRPVPADKIAELVTESTFISHVRTGS